MRRMRQHLKSTFYLRKAVTTKDAEGNTFSSWDDPISIRAIIRHASGQMDVAQYGQRLSYILKMQYEDSESIQEGDGICVYVGANDDPDYKVISVKGLTGDTFNTYALEAI